MQFSTKQRRADLQRTACAVVGVFEQRRLSAAAKTLDTASGGRITEVLKRGDLDGKAGATLLLHALPNLPCERVLLVGLGPEKTVGERQYRDAVRAAIKTLSGTGASEAACYLAEVPLKTRDLAWKLEQIVIGAGEALYRFDQLKSKADAGKSSLRRLDLMVTQAAELAPAQAAVARGTAIVAGMNLAKDLGNLPGNHCTPSYLASQAKALAKAAKLKVKVLNAKEMAKLGMGSLLSVAKGSDEPPRFIVLEYAGGDERDKPVVLVGKGITFDSGGISLKPPAEMDEMKYDMAGAASVLGALRAVAELRLPLNVVGLIPTCENLPSGRANKPGDIVTSMSGQTIEVLNTDAEGRLILCDALTYAERFEPAAVIDVATLTGACVIALGHVTSGLLANDDELAHQVQAAGDAAYDRCWRLPLFDDYQEQLNSNFADMANIGGRPAGTITAAAFLSRFAKKYPWAHLDIAGTAWKSGKEKGGTGRPVPLLVHFLSQRAGVK
jgi:leucyl aminopeptidase